MTRENDIRNAAWDYFQDLDSHHFHLLPHCNSQTDAFEAGAEWADNNPKNDVYRDANGDVLSLEEIGKRYKQGIDYRKKKMIDKACDWLSKTLYIHTEEIEDKFWNETKTFDWVTSDYDSVIDFIDDFRKAMGE